MLRPGRRSAPPTCVRPSAPPTRRCTAHRRRHSTGPTPWSPDAQATLVGRGVLALTLHDFAEAARLGAEARALDPYDGDALTVLVDATVELGRYDEAASLLDQLLALRPGLAAYSRLSYLRELNGDVPGARLAIQQAETAGAGEPYDVATVLAIQRRPRAEAGQSGRGRRGLFVGARHLARRRPGRDRHGSGRGVERFTPGARSGDRTARGADLDATVAGSPRAAG